MTPEKFRRGAYVKGEYIFPKTQKDKIWFTMSNFSGSGVPEADVKKCFNKAFLATMRHDDMEPNTMDYTKCFSYKHYGWDINWDEDTTTTPEMFRIKDIKQFKNRTSFSFTT